MHIYQLLSITILLSVWKCEGWRPPLSRELFESSSVKSNGNLKAGEFRSEDRAKMLSSLLDSSSILDNNLHAAFKAKPEKAENDKMQTNKDKLRKELAWKLSSEASMKDSASSSSIGTSKSVKSVLIDKIMKMSEENAAELVRTLLTSDSDKQAKSYAQSWTKDPYKPARIMNGDPPAISDLSRLVSLGYNLIRGCPDGQFETGGSDPGIRTAQQIFKYSFDQDKTDSNSLAEPDQVEFIDYANYTLDSYYYVFGGEKSYRDSMNDEVDAAGAYKSLQFSASDAVEDAHDEATSTQSLFFHRKLTRIVGEVRYLHNEDNVVNDITDEFYNDVMNLPSSFFNSQLYHNFLDKWGTDFIVKAEVGQKHLTRYRANYTTAYKYGRSLTSNPLDSGDVGSGIINIDIATLNDRISNSSPSVNYDTEFDYVDEFQMGTQEAPVPIKLFLRPISIALGDNFWLSRFGPKDDASAAQLYSILRFKKMILMRELENYAWSFGHLPEDPMFTIPIKWPQGTYALPRTWFDCPTHFVSGCRTQDNEDYENANNFSLNINLDLWGEFDDGDKNVQTCYCSKIQDDDANIFTWMPGRYCINRKNDTCPAGFSTGYVKWDDESTNNKHGAVEGELPDGEYPIGSTLINFCCRDDGSPEDRILLPNTSPFVLYPYKEEKCQAVRGMEFTQHFVHTDDEDVDNQNECDGEVPYMDCSEPDFNITYCYYY